MTRVTLAMLLGLIAAGCGGGGATFGGGISGTGKIAVRFGPLEQDGAVVIGGTTFDANAADVTVNGATTPIADLRKGMLAFVTGMVDAATAVATSVEVDEVLRGPLENKLDAVTMAVVGQKVEITPDTVFDAGISPASLAGLTVGDPLVIYGFIREAGVISATRVERKASPSEIRVTGVIAALDTNAETFDIGTQTVDYSNAVTAGLPGGVPANGLIVQVRGDPLLNGMGEVVANEVKAVDVDGPDDAEDVEIEGFVTQVSSPTEFVIGTQTVQTNGNTVFDGGTAIEVVVGVKLQVEGSIKGGILDANEVKFGENVKVESDVDTVIGNTITLVGLPGLTVLVTAATRYEGNAGNLGDVVAGNHVKIRGRMAGATSMTATRVDETSADTDVELQGPVDAAPAPADPTLSVLGVLVNTAGLADNDFGNANDQDIGRAAFFAAAVPGRLVDLSGTLLGVIVTWDEASLEDED